MSGLRLFRSGDVLRAADLRAMADVVRDLQRRVAVLQMGGAGVRRARQGRMAFELAYRRGLMWVRRGFVCLGGADLIPVGDAEWTCLGEIRACTVWLAVDVAARAAVVEVGELDLEAPSTPLHMRLGYVRPDDEDEKRLHCVQCRRGVVYPCSPCRVRGVPMGEMPDELDLSSTHVLCADAGRMTAGEKRTTGVAVYGGGRVRYGTTLSYAVTRYSYFVGAEAGGWRRWPALSVTR